MIKVEICINCDSLHGINDSVSAAYWGGASRVELCSSMHLDGLTPNFEQLKYARNTFRDRPGLLVMIRPRPGDFNYSYKEVDRMIRQINMAAESGADGIVLGVLKEKDNSIDVDLLLKLKEIAAQYNLPVTFHRAFDATPDPLRAMESLIELGIERVLTSGTPWGKKGTALDGIDKLKEIVEISKGRIEIVIGGGINIYNVKKILRDLSCPLNSISVHSYSGVQKSGMTNLEMVKSFVDEVQSIDLVN